MLTAEGDSAEEIVTAQAFCIRKACGRVGHVNAADEATDACDVAKVVKRRNPGRLCIGYRRIEGSISGYNELVVTKRVSWVN